MTVAVRGNANAEELAAIVAILTSRPEPEPDGYRDWRETRLKALRNKGLRDSPEL
jgi:hypothetical protein